MVNEGIFDTVTDVLQSEDKKLVLTGYSNLDLMICIILLTILILHSLRSISKRELLLWLQNRYSHSLLEPGS